MLASRCNRLLWTCRQPQKRGPSYIGVTYIAVCPHSTAVVPGCAILSLPLDCLLRVFPLRACYCPVTFDLARSANYFSIHTPPSSVQFLTPRRYPGNDCSDRRQTTTSELPKSIRWRKRVCLVLFPPQWPPILSPLGPSAFRVALALTPQVAHRVRQHAPGLFARAHSAKNQPPECWRRPLTKSPAGAFV